MSFLKPNKPGSFDGTRDAMTVRAWLHSVEKYLRLIQVGQNTEISAETAVDFASTFMTGTAANWWFTIVHEGKVPPTWEAFKLLVETEFVPQDSTIRARDRLNKLKQRRSVADYLSEFRNVVIDIPDMSEGEKLARFTEGLKPHILLEVRKENPLRLDAAATIALSVDGAYYGAGFYSGNGTQNRGFAPMEIGNFERSSWNKNTPQKENRNRKGGCYICGKRGCHSRRHDDEKKPTHTENKNKNKKVSWNNTQVEKNIKDSFPQEN